MSPPDDISWMFERFARFGSAEAITSHNRLWSYEDLIDDIKLKKRVFDESGIKPGDVVLLQCLDYSHSAISSLWALWSIGAIALPLLIHPHQKTPFFPAEADITWICTIQYPSETVELQSVKVTDVAPEIATRKLEILRKKKHAGFILKTSGTTAQPRLVLHDVNIFLDRFTRERQPARTLAFLMFDHMGGIDTMCHTLSSGGTLILPNPGERGPESVAELIDRFQVQLLPTSPTFLNHLLLSNILETFQLSSLTKISFGTEPMPALTLSKLTNHFPSIRILQSYGTTELGVPGIRTNPANPAWIQIRPDHHEMKIIEGMLFIRSKAAMVGYLNAADPFDEEGWYATGDLVEIDPSGEYFRVLGRTSDIINVGGEKVSAARVEEVIRQAKNIRNVLVTGKNNPLIGQMVVAKIELVEPEKPVELARRLRDYCKNLLAKYEIPSQFEVVDQLELTSSGKLKRQIDKSDVSEGDSTD